MPPAVILEPGRLDFTKPLFDQAYIHTLNPQRYEFDMLDAIVHFDAEARIFAGYHDVREDAWWGRGHVPGRARLPRSEERRGGKEWRARWASDP